MTYTLTHEDGTETFDVLDEALDRAADMAIEGTLIESLIGPEGAFSHDLIDQYMYRKLDAADPNVDLIAAPREDHHAIPPPAPVEG